MGLTADASACCRKACLGSAHPLPSLAVTALATTVSAAAGRSPGGCVLVAAAVLTGQLSIGWCNDLVDRGRDLAAGRRDKPLVTGAVPPRVVAIACALSAAACVPLSLASGWRAGVAHLAGVAGGWAYDLGVKRTVWSWLPYAASFALLTAFLTLGLPGHPAPPAWLLLAGALLGTGAHFLNVVPDVEADLAAGVRGLPQRLGAARAARGRCGAADRGRAGRDRRPGAAAVVGLGGVRRRELLRGRGRRPGGARQLGARPVPARGGHRGARGRPARRPGTGPGLRVATLPTVEHTRRARARTAAATAVSAVAVAALLAGCAAGFDATAAQPYAPADGVLADSGELRVQNALVVASDSISSGVISATIANRGDTDDELTGLTSPDGTVDLTGDGALPAGSSVRLGADTDLSATISALTALPGETITLRLTFARAEPLRIRTVVVPAEGPYESITPGPTTLVE